MNWKDKLDELNFKIGTLRIEAKEATSKIIEEVVKEVFEKYSWLQSFYWRQYTDYFNDGETTEFHVHYYHLEDAEDFEFVGDLELNDVPQEQREKCAAELVEFMESLDSDSLESIYGDHVCVTVDRDEGITVGDYSDHN